MKRFKVQRRPKYENGKKAYCKGWYIRPNGKWIYLSDKKDEAEELAKQYSRQADGLAVKGYNTEADFGEAVDMYLKHKGTELTTKKSIQRNAAPMRKFQEYINGIGITRVSEIKKEQVLDYLNNRVVEKTGKPISDRTWNLERTTLNNFFKYCADDDRRWIIKNPITFRPKTLSDPEVDRLSEEQIPIVGKALQEIQKKRPTYQIFMTLAYTGARVGEVIRMFKNDVDLKHLYIKIRPKSVRRSGREGTWYEDWKPKNKKVREVPIPDKLIPIIKQQLKTKSEFLFPNSKGNMVMDGQVLEDLQKACAVAGVKIVHAHSVRHSFCAENITKGQPYAYVQKVMGHQSDNMTRRYASLAPDAITKKFKDLSYGDD